MSFQASGTGMQPICTRGCLEGAPMAPGPILCGSALTPCVKFPEHTLHPENTGTGHGSAGCMLGEAEAKVLEAGGSALRAGGCAKALLLETPCRREPHQH